jgi:hypothetical protein
VKTQSIVWILAWGWIALPAFAGTVEGDPTAAEIVTLYQTMHAALAADQTTGVVEAAAAIALKAEPCECGAENTAAYAALTAAARAVQGKDIAALREQFKSLTRALGDLVAAAGVGGVQVYYCPMAEGYWLQSASDAGLRNPYLGAAMISCGSKVDKVEN